MLPTPRTRFPRATARRCAEESAQVPSRRPKVDALTRKGTGAERGASGPRSDTAGVGATRRGKRSSTSRWFTTALVNLLQLLGLCSKRATGCYNVSNKDTADGVFPRRPRAQGGSKMGKVEARSWGPGEGTGEWYGMMGPTMSKRKASSKALWISSFCGTRRCRLAFMNCRHASFHRPPFAPRWILTRE